MIKVSRTYLTGSLRKIVAFIPKIKSTEHAGVVSMIPDGNTLKLVISYPEAAMQASCELAGADNEEQLTILGTKLLSIANVSDAEIRLSEDEGRLSVVSGRSKWVEPMPKVTRKLLQLPEKPKAAFDVYPVLTAFNTVKYAADSDSVRPSLYMVDVIDGRVRACNGYQYHEVSTGISDLTFSVSGGLLDGFISVLRYFDGEVEFFEDDTCYHFKNGSDIITLKKLQLSFPDLDRLLVRPLRSDSPALWQVEKGDLQSALKKVKLAVDDNYPYIEIHLSRKEALLRATQKNGGEAVSSVDSSWDTQPRVVTFNAKYLNKTIKELPEGVLELRFGVDTKNKKSPLVCEGDGLWAMLNQAKVGRKA